MDVNELAKKVQRLEDIEAIKQLKAEYADACDDMYNPARMPDLFTKDAVYPAQFAKLKLVNKDITRLIFAGGIKNAQMTHVVLDGNRYELSVRPKADTGGKTQPSLTYFGAAGGSRLRSTCF